MTKIYKYPIAVACGQFVQVPRISRVLTAQVQHSTICVWIEVDPGAPLVWRRFDVFATGQPIAYADRTFIATVQEGDLVWHVFERHNADGRLDEHLSAGGAEVEG